MPLPRNGPGDLRRPGEQAGQTWRCPRAGLPGRGCRRAGLARAGSLTSKLAIAELLLAAGSPRPDSPPADWRGFGVAGLLSRLARAESLFNRVATAGSSVSRFAMPGLLAIKLATAVLPSKGSPRWSCWQASCQRPGCWRAGSLRSSCSPAGSPRWARRPAGFGVFTCEYARQQVRHLHIVGEQVQATRLIAGQQVGDMASLPPPAGSSRAGVG